MKKTVFVGIGASAGGLNVFEKIINALASNSDYVYIIAQHLDSNKKSALAQILSKHTTMEVSEVSQETNFLPNHIYIVPAGYDLIYLHHHLELQKVDTIQHIPSPSIDKLFEALSLYKKELLVTILLTGTGHDGTQGTKIVKQNGGITIAQSPQDAEYSGMPLSAINAHHIDYVLSIKQINEFLPSIINRDKKKLPLTIEELETPLHNIQIMLSKEKHFDISKYKNETIMRRINKRIGLTHAQDIEEYLLFIKKNPQELQLLYEYILIGVTSFFRDADAFETLKNELFIYLQDKPDQYKLRLWSIACATGEEAYSLAILVTEISEELNRTFHLRIFATDIDEIALTKARSGIYADESLAKMDVSLKKKYFTKIENNYHIVEAIRSKIVFTHHNVLNDPPFIKQDLVSCRNFLIYILPSIQKEIFKLFHYSLKEKGLLFLGSSESTLSSNKYFHTLNSESKIYQKEHLEEPTKISPVYFSQHMKEKSYETTQNNIKTNSENIEQQIAHKIFQFFAPNFVLIDKNHTIIYKKGNLPFLTIGDGFASLNILDNLDKTLRYDVKVLINRAFDSQEMQESKFIETTLHSDKKFLKIIAHPFEMQNNASMLLLYFQLLDTQDLQFKTTNSMIENNSYMLTNLAQQLESVQEDNHLLSDKLIITKENMQLLNEELQSSNEELQSSNEELETSNEELQSSNEELHLSMQNEQLMQAKLSNILNSSIDGIIGLDMNGNHSFVNDATCKLLGFTKDEMLGNNAHKLWHHTKENGKLYPREECTLHYGLNQGIIVRKKDLFWKKDGTSIEVEVSQSPILDANKMIGAVLSFHDITKENLLKKELEYEHRLAEEYLNISGTLVMSLDIYGNILMINPQGCKILGLVKGEAIGKNFVDNFIPLEIRAEVKEIFYSVLKGDNNLVTHWKNPLLDTNKKLHYMSWLNNYTTNSDGEITGVITSGIDITKEEELSQKLQTQEHLYKLTFEEADVGIAHVSFNEKWIDTNEYVSTLLGYTKEALHTMSISDITFSEDIHKDKSLRAKLLRQEIQNYHVEKRYVHKDGSIIWVNISVVLLEDDAGKPLYFLKIIRDITQLKLLMYELQKEKDRFKKIIEFIPIPVIIYNEDGNMLFINKVFKETLGYSHNELKTIHAFTKKMFPNEKIQDLEKLEEFYKNPTVKEVQEQILTSKNGDKKSVILNIATLNKLDSDEKNIYIIAMIDITDIQEKDELMIAQSRQAAMGEMLSMIAHQWRQPLTVISMVGNSLQADIDLGEEITPEALQELITTLSAQTSYLSHTVDDFRSFFKPDKERKETGINTLLENIKNLIIKSLENNNIKLELPEMSDITLLTYPNQLTQVLINIINNAKDALVQTNTEDASITIGLKKEKNNIIISVCDNGGGIDPSIKDKLGQAYVSTKSKNGTGLGIYMSIVIVNKHLNGRLYWESDKKGSCFYVALPME